MYLYITKVTDNDGDTSYFGPFRSESNAKLWGIDETNYSKGYTFITIPLLDPHYINDFE